MAAARPTGHWAPTLRLVALCAAGVPLALLPVLADPRLWLVWVGWFASVVLVAAVDLALILPARSIGLQAAAPDALALLRPGGLRLRFTSAGPRATRLTVRCDVAGPLDPVDDAQVEVPGRGTADLVLPLLARRRGRGEVQAAWLRWQGPLGLVRRAVRRPLSTPIAVIPDVRAMQVAALRFMQSRGELGIKSVRFIGDGSEFESLREFQPGLDHRAIDWRTSARHRRLLSRELRAERNHPVVLAIDTGRLMAEPVDGAARLDRAVHAALVLGLVAVKTGDRVGLFAFDERPRQFHAPGRGMAAFRRVQRLTADLAYTTSETNFTLGLLELYRRLPRRALVVLFTDFVDTLTAELMVENAGRLARRHLVVFVSIRDPLLLEARDREPRSMPDVHRSAVADELLAEREAVLRRLRRLGVLCIDVPWRQVTAELLNRYLEAKRRELVG